MPSFLQRLRHPHRHASRTDISRTAEKERKRREEFEDDYPDEVAPGRNRIPSLPEMQDNGPYSNIRYISEDLFWNSALTEAGEGARIQVRPDQSTSKRRNASNTTEHDRRRTALRKQEEAMSYERDYAKFTQLQADAARQYAYGNQGLGRLDHAKIVWGRERADNDRYIMSYCIPVSPGPASVPLMPSKRAPVPLHPSTREWDEFMDFETREDEHAYGNQCETEYTANKHLHPMTAPHSIVEGGKELPPLPPLWYENACLPKSSHDSHENLVQTTYAHAEKNVDQNTVNLDSKDDAQKAANETTITNGTGPEHHVSPSTTAQDIDPIIARDLLANTKDTPTKEHTPTLPLTNGVHYTTTSPSRDKHSSLFVNRSPSPYPTYLASTPPHDIPSPHRSSTASTSNDPSPPNSHASSRSLQSLLRTVLSPSELSLFNHAGPNPKYPASPENPYAFGGLQARLVSKCYTLIHHLQDRNAYWESELVPRLSEDLEGKTFVIELLSSETREFSKQIMELRRAIDFGNKILAGCWEREFEMWRTLATIRQGRRNKGMMGMLRRLRGGKKTSRLDEGLMPPVSESKQALLKRELDAVMLMAEQNVRILREDADEMSGRVNALKRRFRGMRVEREVEPGSWRDI